jgi:hypothetical protein
MTSPWSKPKPEPCERSGRLSHRPRCPRCASLLNGFTNLDPGCTPTPGDVSICIYCRALVSFDAELALVEIVGDDAIILRANPRIKRLLEVLDMAMPPPIAAASERGGTTVMSRFKIIVRSEGTEGIVHVTPDRAEAELIARGLVGKLLRAGDTVIGTILEAWVEEDGEPGKVTS